jgi:hypothetical protein
VNFINPEPGDYSVLVIAFNTAPTPGSQHIRGALLDADGKPLKATGTGSRSSASRIDLDLSFSQGNAGAPAKLVITVPGKIDEMKVPFEFGQRPAAAPAN